MKLSVVIPCYNGGETLAAQLDALVVQEWTQPWEIVFSDNRSTDNSREIAMEYRQRLPNLRIVDASERQGQPFALNTGIRAALGESVALTDADDIVAPGWVAAMGEALAEHEFVGCRIETAMLNPPWLRGHGQETGLQEIWYPPWLPHVGGGTMGFRKSLFEKVGDFDDALPYLHDTDYCFRAQKKGYRIHFVADAVLHLRKRDSVMGNFRQSRNYAEYNAILARRYWGKDDSALPFYAKFFREWLALLLSIRQLRRRNSRFIWMWRLGCQVGRVRGVVLRRGIPV